MRIVHCFLHAVSSCSLLFWISLVLRLAALLVCATSNILWVNSVTEAEHHLKLCVQMWKVWGTHFLFRGFARSRKYPCSPFPLPVASARSIKSVVSFVLGSVGMWKQLKLLLDSNQVLNLPSLPMHNKLLSYSIPLLTSRANTEIMSSSWGAAVSNDCDAVLSRRNLPSLISC